MGSRRDLPTFQEIARHITVPQRLPLDCDKDQYIAFQVDAVRALMAKGYTLEQALHGSGWSMDDKSQHAPKPAWMIVLIATIIAVVVSSIGFGVWFVAKQKFAPAPTQALSSLGEDVHMSGVEKDETILLVGSDRRPVTNQGDGSWDDVPGVRTDVVVVVSIPADGSRAIAVSLPRDVAVNRPECQAYDTLSQRYIPITEPEAQGVKINSVYNVGGPQCLVSTVEQFVGMPITRYAEIDFDSFESLIDAIGGVSITTTGPIVDDILGTIIGGAGQHTLDGKTALGYVRARHVQGEMLSDFDRIGRQHQLAASIVSKIRSLDQADTAQVISSVVATVLPHMKTDMLNADDAARIAYSVATMRPEAIRMTTLPVIDDPAGTGNLLPQHPQSDVLLEALRTHAPLQGDAPRGVDPHHVVTAHPMPESDVTALIVSPSPHDERSTSLATALQDVGVKATTAYDPTFTPQTTIVVSPGNVNAAATLMSLLPHSHVRYADKQPLPVPDNVVVISIGEDFNLAGRIADNVVPREDIAIPTDTVARRAGDIIPEALPHHEGSKVRTIRPEPQGGIH